MMIVWSFTLKTVLVSLLEVRGHLQKNMVGCLYHEVQLYLMNEIPSYADGDTSVHELESILDPVKKEMLEARILGKVR